MNHPALYMCLIGCKPTGRHIEQHDIFFGIASTAAELISQMEAFWPDGGRLHLDAWRRVSQVDNVRVSIGEKQAGPPGNVHSGHEDRGQRQLYFINLGGYQPGRFEEYHHKLLTVQPDKAAAILRAKQAAFFKQATGAHLDDQYGVDIDELYNVEDILPAALKARYYLVFEDHDATGGPGLMEDTWQIGYAKFSQFSKLF